MKIKDTLASHPWWTAGGILALVTLWLLSGTLAHRPKPAPVAAAPAAEDPAARPRVQVREQQAERVTRYVSVYGRTAPARSVAVKAETNGRVEALGAARGQPVHRGDVILRLDLRDREARLAQAKAGVAQEETAYRGQLELKPKGYISDTQLAETLAKLEGAKTELVRAELDLQYMTVRAPFDGVLQDRQVEIGDYVKSGDPVATFVDNTRLIVTGSIAEQEARFVAPGAEAEAKLVTGQRVQGHLRYISAVAAESTRTFTVELELPNPQGAIPAGVTAEMQIPAGEVLAHKISPALLQLAADGQVGVKTVDAERRVVFNVVQIARAEPDGVWVTGLPAAAGVIVVGQAYVTAGQVVEAQPALQDTALAAGSLENLR